MEEEVQWYLGFVFKDIGDDKYVIEHLERHAQSQNDFWRHPKVEDVQTVFMEFGKYLHQQPHVLIQSVILKTHNR